MNGPLSDYWVVEYQFHGESFHVSKLTDYLSHSCSCCNEGRFFGSTILAIHPNEAGAREECSAWMDRRDKWPVPERTRKRFSDLKRYLDGIEAQCESE